MRSSCESKTSEKCVMNFECKYLILEKYESSRKNKIMTSNLSTLFERVNELFIKVHFLLEMR